MNATCISRYSRTRYSRTRYSRTRQLITRQLVTGLLVTGLSVAGLGISSAWADSSRNDRHSYDRHSYDSKEHRKPHRKHSGQTFARVVAVDPITQAVAQRIPHQQCWTERVRYEGSNEGYRSNTAAIFGGILGAAIGNNIGRNHHRDNRNIKTLAGGLLGAAIGGEISANRRSPQLPARYRNEERCSTEYETRWQQTITGYNVTYRYQGETYNTRMDYDPGAKIRVNVQVRPVS
ncbi:MAG: hypothetical protein ACI9W6_002195 [Motiliproteus sp.]|jgi:uncharacterized protein YcfJ